MATITLGLIGDNIARSQSPRLHVEAGRLCGLDVTYNRLIPRDLGAGFDVVFERCIERGFRGINVTYPYKEAVVSRLHVPDPLTASISACNTVLFGPARPEGHNTDYSGFIGAFTSAFGPAAKAGKVAMAGAGGVGKAIAFALSQLGASELRIFDTDRAKATGLAAGLRAADIPTSLVVAESIADAVRGADGLVNCTPLGMSGHPGAAMGPEHMAGASWAFDAVYTPVDTQFLAHAQAAGLDILSGYELFFHQGVDAFGLFTGLDVDEAALRRALAGAPRRRAIS